jgi:hypothetical protein
MCITNLKDALATIKIKATVNKFIALRPGMHITHATVYTEGIIQ